MATRARVVGPGGSHPAALGAMSKRRRQLVDPGDRVDEDCGETRGAAICPITPRTPIAAAIARKAAKEKKCALGGLLGAYVDDDDDEETEGAATEPPHPWKKLRDAATGHDYYWNQDDGSVSWTLPSSGADAKGKDADATAAGAETAANGDAGEAAPDGADTPVAKFEIPTPKPDVRTFADLLLAQANEALGFETRSTPCRRSSSWCWTSNDAWRTTNAVARAAAAAQTAAAARWRRRTISRTRALEALREAERRLPDAIEAFKADRSKPAAAEVARRVAAARAAAGAASRRASTDAMKPSTDGGHARVDQGETLGRGPRSGPGARARPPPPRRRTTRSRTRLHHRRRPSTSSPRVPHPRRAGGERCRASAEPSAADSRGAQSRRGSRGRPAPGRTFVSGRRARRRSISGTAPGLSGRRRRRGRRLRGRRRRRIQRRWRRGVGTRLSGGRKTRRGARRGAITPTSPHRG